MAREAVYKYMKYQNRPFSVNDIAANLKDHGKVAVQKALDILVENGQVLEKIYGKQKIYCIIQDSELSTNELIKIERDLQTQANETDSKFQDLDREVKAYENKIYFLTSSLTLEEVKQQREQLQKDIAHLGKKLTDKMQHANALEKLHETKRNSETLFKIYSDAYLKRKRICIDVVNVISENYPGNLKQLYSDIGIEPLIV